MKIFSADKIISLDKLAIDVLKIPSIILMENAAKNIVNILISEKIIGQNNHIYIFSGKGNNAGDGFAIARLLNCHNYKVTIVKIFPENNFSKDAKINFDILPNLGIEIIDFEASQNLNFEDSIIIDAILGTGFKGNLSDKVANAITFINSCKPQKVIAIDIPSGICANTGQINTNAINADITMSIAAFKLGHFIPPGAANSGKLYNVDISIPQKFINEIPHDMTEISIHDIKIPNRNDFLYKNKFGHTLLIGGRNGKYGAIVLSALSALKSGVGLITVASDAKSLEIIAKKLPPEIMTIDFANIDDFSKYDSILIGPGLGNDLPIEKLINQIDKIKNIVIDADAITLFPQKSNCVFTPHYSEFAKMQKITMDELNENFYEKIDFLDKNSKSIFVIKGFVNFCIDGVSNGDGIGNTTNNLSSNKFVLREPNSALSKAGSGDTLAGLIASLIAQGFESKEASKLALYIQSRSAKILCKKMAKESITPTDVIDNYSKVFEEIH